MTPQFTSTNKKAADVDQAEGEINDPLLFFGPLLQTSLPPGLQYQTSESYPKSRSPNFGLSSGGTFNLIMQRSDEQY